MAFLLGPIHQLSSGTSDCARRDQTIASPAACCVCLRGINLFILPHAARRAIAAAVLFLIHDQRPVSDQYRRPRGLPFLLSPVPPPKRVEPRKENKGKDKGEVYSKEHKGKDKGKVHSWGGPRVFPLAGLPYVLPHLVPLRDLRLAPGEEAVARLALAAATPPALIRICLVDLVMEVRPNRRVAWQDTVLLVRCSCFCQRPFPEGDL